ncbi:MAG: glycosyltransferase [Vicinamibacterales bacterium]
MARGGGGLGAGAGLRALGWCIADDGSSDARSRAALARAADRDPRIRLHRAERQGGVSAASNLALAHATGEFVALLDHDDVLAPHALASVVALLNTGDTPFDVIYSDEDKLDEDGVRCDPYFKPDWSPDLFRSSICACHLLVLRRTLVEEVGGFRSAFDFSQDYDLLLRLDRTDDAHRPRAGRAVSLAQDAGLDGPGRRCQARGPRGRCAALQAHLDRQAIAGRILDAGPPGLYRVQYLVEGQPGVSIVVPSPRATPTALAAWLAQLVAGTRHRPLEIVIVSDTGAVPPVAADGVDVRGVAAGGADSYAARVNLGARTASAPYLLVLHDDLSPQHPEWLDAMLELATRPWVGVVGAKLFDSAGRVRHIGLVLGLGGTVGRPFSGHPGDALGYFSNALCIRNCSAVSGACLMTPKAVFDGAGGFDIRLHDGSAEVDYALRVSAAGRLVVVTPYARLTQASSAAGSDTDAGSDWALLGERWGRQFAADPFYSPHLSRRALDYGLA